MDSLHDLQQPGIHLFPRPGKTHGILAHFQTGGGHPSRIAGLTRGKKHPAVFEALYGLRRGRHIGAFGDTDHAVLDQGCRILVI